MVFAWQWMDGVFGSGSKLFWELCFWNRRVYLFFFFFFFFIFSMENPCDVSNVFSTLENDNLTIIFFRFDLTKKRELKR